MKLVDILAAELVSWPDGVTAIEQDLRGNCLYEAKGPALTAYVDGVADDAETAIVTREQWQAAVDALKSGEVAVWSGEGLPPVGESVCEYLGAHQYDEWTVVNIFAHWGEQVFVDYGDGWRAERDLSRLRPIRTPEQIAAEKRNEAQKDIKHIILTSFKIDPVTASSIAGVIADSHYRKVTP